MATSAREFEGITDDDIRHFDFIQTLLHISQSLTKEETRDVKLYCMHLIPKGKAEKLKRAVDVFRVLIELRKIDQENLDFVEEILERIGRDDLIRDAIRSFQPPDREIPENPELQPGVSAEDENEEGMSNTYWVIHGQTRMIQETLDRNRNNIASLIGTRRSQVKFRGYKKHKSILAHFSIPREKTAVLKLMAEYSDPRLVYMGVKSLQIDADLPINITQETIWNDVKRHRPVDDVEVGCSTKSKQQRAPKGWASLSALNLFSDTLPLHLQIAESLEYQGFSYSLVQALMQKYQLREQEMKQLIQNFRAREAELVDSSTFMTMRSKLTISENRLKEALETISALEKELQQAREYEEKAAKQVTSHMTGYRGEKSTGVSFVEYRGEKGFGGWSTQVEKADVATQTHLAADEGTAGKQAAVVETSSTKEDTDQSTAMLNLDSGGDRYETQLMERRGPKSAQAEGEAPGTSAESPKSAFTFGEPGQIPGKFDNPYDVVVSPSNEIFVVEKGNKRVQVHNTEGVYLRHFPTLIPGAEDKKMTPHDIAIDGNGSLWVVGDEGDSHHYVVKYSKEGAAVRKLSLPRIRYYRGIAVDKRSGHILVTETGKKHSEVQVFRPDGSLVRKFTHPGSEMKYPRYITVDGEGNIVVSDCATDYVYKYDQSGKFLLRFGGRGCGEGQLRFPRGICTDSAGHIVVVDSSNYRVQVFTGRGEYVRQVDTGPGIQGAAVGPEGQLVLTNWDDDTVTVFPSY